MSILADAVGVVGGVRAHPVRPGRAGLTLELPRVRNAAAVRALETLVRLVVLTEGHHQLVPAVFAHRHGRAVAAVTERLEREHLDAAVRAFLARDVARGSVRDHVQSVPESRALLDLDAAVAGRLLVRLDRFLDVFLEHEHLVHDLRLLRPWLIAVPEGDPVEVADSAPRPVSLRSRRELRLLDLRREDVLLGLHVRHVVPGEYRDVSLVLAKSERDPDLDVGDCSVHVHHGLRQVHSVSAVTDGPRETVTVLEDGTQLDQPAHRRLVGGNAVGNAGVDHDESNLCKAHYLVIILV